MKAKICICVFASVFLAAPSYAEITPDGDPIVSQSWHARFIALSGTPFDYLAMRIVSVSDGDRLLEPAFDDAPAAYQTLFPFDPTNDDFSGSGWSNTNISDTLAYAAGPAQNLLTFWLGFEGYPWDTPETEMTFDIVSYNGEERLSARRFHWHWETLIGYFTWEDVDWDPGRMDMIPSPGAAMLACIGIACVVGVRRRTS